MNTLGHCTFAGMRYSSLDKLRDAYDVEPHELADATVFFRTFAEASIDFDLSKVDTSKVLTFRSTFKDFKGKTDISMWNINANATITHDALSPHCYKSEKLGLIHWMHLTLNSESRRAFYSLDFKIQKMMKSCINANKDGYALYLKWITAAISVSEALDMNLDDNPLEIARLAWTMYTKENTARIEQIELPTIEF